ncbi:DsbA family protein [Sporolactobacillus vineae]|uniref:DsbA family protein n=1 Tax=Sporolactobacillus vineae TaxID=444463 RepID=UPI001EE65AF0|nr:DsbA family protein [Sporolactobacillus vineae]
MCPLTRRKHPEEPETKSEELKRDRGRMVVFSSIIIVLLIAAIAVMVYRDQQRNAVKPVNRQATHRTAQTDTTKINYAIQPILGSTNAPVKIAEFADYRCPYCKTFEETVVPRLQQDYINTNKASFSFINYTILGPESLLAAEASEEVYHQNPKGFWAFHKALYQEQGSESKPWVTEKLLTDTARKTVPSLDVKAFQNALTTQSHKQAIAADNELGEDLGVPGTPAIFVNGKYIKNGQDYKVLKKAIDQALKNP